MNSPGTQYAESATEVEATRTRIAYRMHRDLPWFVLPPDRPSQWIPDAALAPIPNVKPWMCGVLNARGLLVPVFDLALWAGMPRSEGAFRVLVVAPGSDAVGVLCSDPPQLVETEQVIALSDSIPLSEFAIGAFASQALGRVIEFEPMHWLSKISRQIPGYQNTT